jgi:tetrahydrodipicolinate N-succinyltransferase
LKSTDDWVVSETLVKTGASIGAHATIVCGTTIGRWAMIGAGAVVTRDVPDFGLVYGNPAHLHGFVCPCGEKLPEATAMSGDEVSLVCTRCGRHTSTPRSVYAQKV